MTRMGCAAAFSTHALPPHSRIRKELANAEKQLAGQNAKLANENFVSRAPEAVVNTEREKKAKLEALIENLNQSLAALG